jgi:hypothetical protein
MVWSDRNMSWLWYIFKILKLHDIVGGDGDNFLFLRLVPSNDVNLQNVRL